MFHPVLPGENGRPPGRAPALSVSARFARTALLGLAAVCGFAGCALAQTPQDDAPLRTRAAWREGIAKLEQYRRGIGPAPAPMRVGPARPAAPRFRLPPFAPPVSALAWRDIIRNASRRHGIDEALLTAVIRVESNFNPHAVSGKGALGAMQIMPETGDALGLKDFFDPAANTEAGARYLAEMLRLFPRLELSLAAYNAGPEAVRRHGGSIPPYRETQRYVRQVLAEYRRLTPQRAQ